MGGLTWQSLLEPEYIMTFLEGFLLGAIPVLGFGKSVEGSGYVDVTTMPSVATAVIALFYGVLNGIRALRNLRAPAPLPKEKQ